MRWIPALLILLLLATLCWADEESNRPDLSGPLGVRSEALLINQGLAWTPGRLHALTSGEYEHHIYINHVNLWGPEDSYFADMEQTRYVNLWRFGLGKGWEVSFELGKVWRGGGTLDGTIEWFHNTFGLASVKRPDHPHNDLNFTTNGIKHLSKIDAGLGFANPVVGIKREFFSLSRLMDLPNVALEALVKLPLGDIKGNRATKGWDFLIDAQVQIPAGRAFSFYSTIGVLVTPGQEYIFGIKTRSMQMFLFFGMELRVDPNVILEFGYTYHESVTKDEKYGALSKGAHEYAMGVKWALRANLFMEFGIIENSVNDFNTPDFGLHVGITYRAK